MADRVIQSSFNVGEIAPAIYARTDLAKYHSAAALLRNFFVDYRGGASTRSGTQYILQCYKSSKPVRLISFQASPTVNYILEFGDYYIRFFNNRQPILETAINVTAYDGVGTATIPGNAYAAGDWFYHSTDATYYVVTAAAGDNVTLTNLNGSAPSFVGLGTAARVYTLTSPYAAADLAKVKFAQNVSAMILCHPLYPPQVLSLITFNNWTIAPIQFGSSAGVPGNLTIGTSLSSGSVSYSYVVSSVDSTNQESAASQPVGLTAKQDLRTTAGTIQVGWDPVPGAISYNVYKGDVTYFGTIGAGSPYGFVGNTQATNFKDSNIAADYATTPTLPQNPFTGSGIANIQVVTGGTYPAVPSINIGGSPIVGASAVGNLSIPPNVTTISAAGSGYNVGDTVNFGYGVVAQVLARNTGGGVTSFSLNPGRGYISGTGTPTPSNPMSQVSTSGSGTGFKIAPAWALTSVSINQPGFGYTSVPSVTASPAPSTGTTSLFANLTAATDGYPAVPQFFQQRLVFAGSTRSPGGFNLSQPGSYYNFNVSRPAQADDAISATLVSGQLNTIKSMVSTSAGLILLTDKALWLVNGGGAGSAVTPSGIVANIQTYNGASDLPPIVVNYDVLYVQAKGSIVRDASYNLYANVYTGSDVSVLSSHLFYGHSLIEWAYAEEPFKIIWAVRDDGQLLSLTFLKEQEFTGWAHSDTTNGLFRSVAVVSEPLVQGSTDAVYVVVDRVIGGQTVKYIERIADRDYVTMADCWSVDCALRYIGSPTTTVKGAQHLVGQTVTGLADGVVIPPFTMPATGTFTLPTPASKVIIGLGFTAQLKTLAIDTGEPTIQGRQKKISDSVLRVDKTLGLKIGTSSSALVQMKDLWLGNVGSYLNQPVTDLVTGDARTYLDPSWNAFGQYLIQQDMPYPATILGVMPGLVVGDTAK